MVPLMASIMILIPISEARVKIPPMREDQDSAFRRMSCSRMENRIYGSSSTRNLEQKSTKSKHIRCCRGLASSHMLWRKVPKCSSNMCGLWVCSMVIKSGQAEISQSSIEISM